MFIMLKRIPQEYLFVASRVFAFNQFKLTFITHVFLIIIILNNLLAALMSVAAINLEG